MKILNVFKVSFFFDGIQHVYRVAAFNIGDASRHAIKRAGLTYGVPCKVCRISCAPTGDTVIYSNDSEFRKFPIVEGLNSIG